MKMSGGTDFGLGNFEEVFDAQGILDVLCCESLALARFWRVSVFTPVA